MGDLIIGDRPAVRTYPDAHYFLLLAASVRGAAWWPRLADCSVVSPSSFITRHSAPLSHVTWPTSCARRGFTLYTLRRRAFNRKCNIINFGKQVLREYTLRSALSVSWFAECHRSKVRRRKLTAIADIGLGPIVRLRILWQLANNNRLII